MREIKFRAWDKRLNKMLCQKDSANFVSDHWLTYGVCFGVDSVDTFSEVDDLIPMQFTGLHDKNGKEIWEGDIVQWQAGHYSTILMKEVARFENGLLIPFYNMEAHDHDVWDYSIDNYKYEVLGNIYENKELLT